ncbi:MAG: kynureninase [Candidatus Hodarchaeales archaeon]|jgi:kynureninase
MEKYQNNRKFAENLDLHDSLKDLKEKFYIPKQPNGNDYIYFCGNSLGLQPKTVKKYIDEELEDWKTKGVEGHYNAKRPWLSYHEIFSDSIGKLIGAKPDEVVTMNTLSVNIHLMFVSFYQPKDKKRKIMMEAGSFPSDTYAVKSQLLFHGYNPEEDIIFVEPREGERTLRTEDILKLINNQGEEIALIWFGGINYATGQVFDMEKITKTGHDNQIVVGFDLAHAIGNVPMDLHKWNVDFATWCTYKYLNGGPGSIAGAFIHERHHHNEDLHRFAGWWGHDKETRFLMGPKFNPINTAEGWQISNPPVFSMTPLRASLDIFDEVGIGRLREKSLNLTNYFEYLLKENLNEKITIITPNNTEERGCQLSVVVKHNPKKIHKQLHPNGIICDWREPDIIRCAPVPLYNSYADIYDFVQILQQLIEKIQDKN